MRSLTTQDEVRSENRTRNDTRREGRWLRLEYEDLLQRTENVRLVLPPSRSRENYLVVENMNSVGSTG